MNKIIFLASFNTINLVISEKCCTFANVNEKIYSISKQRHIKHNNKIINLKNN